MLKKVKVSYDTQLKFISLYLNLFSNSINITPKEHEVLIRIIKHYFELKGKVEEPYLTELILSTDRRKEIQDELKIEATSFTNVLKSLKDKGIFGEDKKSLLEILYPSNQILFTFELEDKKINKSFEKIKTKILEIDEEPLSNVLELENIEEDTQTFDGSGYNKDNLIQIKISTK